MDNILDNIGQYFRTQEKPDFSIQFSRYRRNAILIIEEEADKAKPGDTIRIYAVGGEGILYDCLNAVAHYPNMQLVPVPYGEYNDFLDIFGKDNIESFRDIPSLVKGEAHSTDIIRWGVNYSLNSCYIGMNAAITKKVKDLKSSLNKGSFLLFSKISAFFNNISAVFDKQSAAREYTINIDDHDYSGHYSLIHVANGPYHDGKLTGVSNATPDDGVLDIALIKASHPLRTWWSMSRYSRGKRSRNCIHVQAKKISVHSNTQMWIQLDNEYIQDTSIDMSLVHHAVKMVAVNDLSYPVASIAAL
jgi:diacylglycerol kinase family enzyme